MDRVGTSASIGVGDGLSKDDAGSCGDGVDVGADVAEDGGTGSRVGRERMNTCSRMNRSGVLPLLLASASLSALTWIDWALNAAPCSGCPTRRQ